MCREPNPRVLADYGARVFDSKILLAHVYSLRFHQQRDIGAVVHDETWFILTNLGKARQSRRNRSGSFEKLPAGGAFIAILQKLNPGFRHHFQE